MYIGLYIGFTYQEPLKNAQNELLQIINDTRTSQDLSTLQQIYQILYQFIFEAESPRKFATFLFDDIIRHITNLYITTRKYIDTKHPDLIPDTQFMVKLLAWTMYSQIQYALISALSVVQRITTKELVD